MSEQVDASAPLDRYALGRKLCAIVTAAKTWEDASREFCRLLASAPSPAIRDQPRQPDVAALVEALEPFARLLEDDEDDPPLITLGDAVRLPVKVAKGDVRRARAVLAAYRASQPKADAVQPGRGVTDEIVEKAWAAVVGSDIAKTCQHASFIRADLRDALETVWPIPHDPASADRPGAAETAGDPS